MTVKPPRAEDVEALVDAFQQAGFGELHVRFPGFELHLAGEEPSHLVGARSAEPPQRARAASTPAPLLGPPSPPAASAKLPVAAADLEGFAVVRAPYLGVFYRAPKPGDPPYVELGQAVTAETDVCLVEVMKLFTAVRAGAAGKVERILAADGAMVEAGQPLFAIAPEA